MLARVGILRMIALRSLPEVAPIDDFCWPAERPFLTAEWRQLAMVNYEVDPAVLARLIPAGTELDFEDGKTYVSLVGFLFLNTRLMGLRIPGHTNFEEVNLRFYVRHAASEGWRRGVVFIRELVPRRALTLVARKVYAENYATASMTSAISSSRTTDDVARHAVVYTWRFARQDYRLALDAVGDPAPLVPGSHEEFIAEHYWGYTAWPDGTAREYRVAHPPWRAVTGARAEFTGDVAALYGGEFAPFLVVPPTSAFLAEGSAVRVYRGCRLR